MSSRNLVVCSPHCRLRILLQVAAALAMVQVQHVRSFASCMPFFSRSMLLFLHHTATSIRTHSATEPSSYTPHRLMHPSHSYAPLPLFGSRWPSSRSHTHTHTHTHCACASLVSLHRWCVIAAPAGACRLPPCPRPTWSRRLRHVDALLPCANPCARTSARLPRRVLRALHLLREFDSPFHLCAQPLHRHLASQPCAALWRLGLEQLLCVLPRAQKCVATVPLCASPAHLHPCTPLLFWYTSTPSRIIHRHLCPCVALPLCIAAPCRPYSPQVVPCYAAARANRDITMPSPCGLHVVSGARSEYH
jgi:hypothetical protein